MRQVPIVHNPFIFFLSPPQSFSIAYPTLTRPWSAL